MLDLECPECHQDCYASAHVQADGRVIWTADCSHCVVKMEREDEPGPVVVVK